jgi:hypothetical protein
MMLFPCFEALCAGFLMFMAMWVECACSCGVELIFWEMCRVFNQMMCSDPQVDSHRFMDIIDAAVAAGELKEYKVYRKWASEVAKTARPPNPLGPSK